MADMTEQKVWLVSDWHFGHNKDFVWKERGFKSVEEMNEEIICRHNSLVGPDDIVYCLGDCIMGDQDAGIECMSRLNGNIYIAYGNHCTDTKIARYLELDNVVDVQMGYRIKSRKISLWLSHHPQNVRNNGEPSPVFSVAGHTHAKTRFYIDIPNCYNVCIDASDCYPTLLDDAINDIKAYRRGEYPMELEQDSAYIQKSCCLSCSKNPGTCGHSDLFGQCPGFIDVREKNN